MAVLPEAPGESHGEDPRRAAHAIAAARAQAAAAARMRSQTEGRGRSPLTEAQRTGAYAGLVTRAIALSIDLAILQVVALLAGVAVALAINLVPAPSDGVKAIALAVAGVTYLAWVFGYFVTCWVTTGQTLGARAMRIRVIDAHGEPHVHKLRAIVRVVGLVLAVIPLFAGFLIMLWDDRRRCLQDWMAGTTVVHAPPQARIVRQVVPRGHD
jgi:uncharacterized RDD family membrane protein YckC